MWSLKVIKGAELAEKLVPQVRLPEPLTRFIIGRDPSSAWLIVDRTLAISGRHCEIVPTPHGPALRDLSTNGTFVNDAPSRMNGEHVLRDGDRFEIGPFLIAVSGPPMPARPKAVAAPPPPLPVRSPGVADTAPRRGGDPAAMLAAGGGQEKVGLTEILRVASAPAEDSGLDMTRIRMAQAPGPAPVSPPKHQDVPATQPGVATMGPPANLTEALARGLGVPAASLKGHDALRLAEHLAGAARSATQALRQLLEQQAQARRALGSRPVAAAPVRDPNPLRSAASAEAALLALLAAGQGAGPAIERSAAEIQAHQERLRKAVAAATHRLGHQLAPESLQAALPDVPPPTHDQLWALFAAVWDTMGLAPGQGWVAGFEEAARQHLAAAFDDTPPA
jgi:type VI secretion system protein ImpI